MRKRYRDLKPWTLLLSALQILHSVSSLPDSPPKLPTKTPSEMLLPIDSTTALMCEPLFVENTSKIVKANWYKDGLLVATVTNSKNANYESRDAPKGENALPEVGFLVIRNITRSDEGLYWCQLEAKAEKIGEIFALTVAYVGTVAPESEIEFVPTRPKMGAPLVVVCPHVKALPKTSVSWKINNHPISSSKSEPLILSNSSLLLRKFHLSDIGIFECVQSNFAGKTRIFGYLGMEMVIDGDQVPDEDPVIEGNGRPEWPVVYEVLIHFIILCVVICGLLIVYMVYTLFCLKGDFFQFSLHQCFRSCTRLGGGRWRKPIFPQADYIAANQILRIQRV
ncbi:unnamed protein product, partial [Mesorhabditis belari]|uniref:Ig-like domain-containing protein n=1 Tax=Mesorhabditis belari TaxID=2138241 RepID=A0AAF3FG88_9BILA